MTIETFVIGLGIVSATTTLATQGIKAIMKEFGKTPYKNTLAAIVSFVVSIATSVLYAVIEQIQVTAPYIGISVILVVGGFLCATCGYDKVREMFKEIFGGKNK